MKYWRNNVTINGYETKLRRNPFDMHFHTLFPFFSHVNYTRL